MVVVSLLAALGLSFVPVQWVGLLGLISLRDRHAGHQHPRTARR